MTSTTAKAKNFSAGLTAGLAAGFSPKVKGVVAKTLLGRDAAFALIFFGVVATLTGATMSLATVIDPALAATAVGLTVIALLVGTALWVGRPRK